MISTFWLVLGYACNNRCPHCYATPCNFSSEWMNVVFAKEVMSTLKREGAKSCLLIGGEPTLYPGLIDIISFGSGIGLKMVIITNGRRLKSVQFAEQLFSVGLDRAVVSLAGENKDTHNLMTGSDSFEDTISGIRTVVELGYKINTLTTVSKGNSDQIVEIVEFSHQLGAGKAVLNCAIPILGNSSVTADYSLDPIELAGVIDHAFLALKEKEIPFHLNATFPLCLLRQETLSGLFDLGWISVGCQMYRGRGVAFDPSGSILPCTHFSEAPLIKDAMAEGGHFKLKNSFPTIWKDPDSVAGKFRSELWRYPAKKCINCDYWGGCIGGCPLFWTSFDPITFIDRKEVMKIESPRCGGSA